MDETPRQSDKLSIRELEITDEEGTPRIRLSVRYGGAEVELLDKTGRIAASLSDHDGCPSVDFVRGGNVLASFGLGDFGGYLNTLDTASDPEQLESGVDDEDGLGPTPSAAELERLLGLDDDDDGTQLPGNAKQ